jgi:hypothetical protein
MLNDITSQFFDTSKPCPSQIPDCFNLRTEYFQVLDAKRREGGCNSCAERNLRNTFIARIASLMPLGAQPINFVQ